MYENIIVLIAFVGIEASSDACRALDPLFS